MDSYSRINVMPHAKDSFSTKFKIEASDVGSI